MIPFHIDFIVQHSNLYLRFRRSEQAHFELGAKMATFPFLFIRLLLLTKVLEERDPVTGRVTLTVNYEQPATSQIHWPAFHKLIFAKIEFGVLFANGITSPPHSSWAASLHMILEEDDDNWRPCGDQRVVNTIVCSDKRPISRIHEITTLLHVTIVFSFWCDDIIRSHSSRRMLRKLTSQRFLSIWVSTHVCWFVQWHSDIAKVWHIQHSMLLFQHGSDYRVVVDPVRYELTGRNGIGVPRSWDHWRWDQTLWWIKHCFDLRCVATAWWA